MLGSNFGVFFYLILNTHLRLSLNHLHFYTMADISIKINHTLTSANHRFYHVIAVTLAEGNIMIIRNLIHGEETQLFKIFISSVHDIASKDYTQKQINAWAPRDMNMSLWGSYIRKLNPYVVVINGEIVGYSDLQPNGYIDQFFVSGSHARQGIGSLLMEHIHKEAKLRDIDTLTSNVSKTAEAFFICHGFYVVERNFPVRQGVVLENALVKKVLIL